MSDGKIIYEVEIDDDGAVSKVSKTNSEIEGAANSGSSAFQTIWTGALRRIGEGLVELGAKAVESAADVAKEALNQVSAMEQNIGGVQKLFEENADKVIENANKAFQTAGLSANEYMETVTGFSASLIAGLGGDTAKAVDIADRAITDMSDNANTFGTDMQSVMTTYQGFAKQNYTMLDNLKLGYGGTKEEMQRLIEDTAKMKDEQEALGVTIDAESMSFDNIINAISVMQKHLNIAGTTANEAAGTIEGSVNSMKAAWQNFLAGTLDGGELAKVALQAADNVVNAFMEIIPRLITGFVEATPALVGKAGEILTSITTAITDAMPSMMAKGGEILASIGEGFVEGIPSFIEKGLQMLEAFTKSLGDDGGQKMIAGGLKLITSLLQGLINAVPKLIEYIPQIILNLVMAIANNLPQIVQAGVDMIFSLIDGIWQCVPKLIEQLPTIFKAMLQMWKSFNFMELGTMVITKIIDGFAKYVSKIPDYLRNIGNTAVNTFKSINWSSLGANIISGILKGLSNNANAITDSLKNLATSALNAAKSILGIASPSKVFEKEIGLNVDRGFAQGVTNNADLVTNATQAVADQAADVAMNVNYQLPNIDSVSKDMSASFAGSLTSTINRVIEIPLAIDGREIARATAWDMGEQLAWETR